MEKILPGLITASISGFIILVGFIAVTNYKTDDIRSDLKLKDERIAILEKNIAAIIGANLQERVHLNEQRISKIEETRFKPTDFTIGIEPIKTEMRYMVEDIRDIKELLKNAAR